MKINEDIRGDVAVLSVSGALMSGPEVTRFHDHVKMLLKDGITNLVVDFSKVKWFGSAMLGVLAASLASLRAEGGDLRLTGITKKIESHSDGDAAGRNVPHARHHRSSSLELRNATRTTGRPGGLMEAARLAPTRWAAAS